MYTVQTVAGLLPINKDDCWIRNHTIDGTIYEYHIIYGPCKKFLQQSKYIVDIGANSGNHSLAFSALSPPDAKIYSFEPQRKLYDFLTCMIEINQLEHKIFPYNVCLGDVSKNVFMNPLETVREGDEFNMGGLSVGIGGESSTMITLDSLNLEGCDFMKIDVEGSEGIALMGATDTIKKYKPVIMFEHNQTKIVPSNDGHEFSPFYILSGLGYRVYIHLDWGNYITWHESVNPGEIIECLPTNFF
jgi:FkbM family methyltransferase